METRLSVMTARLEIRDNVERGVLAYSGGSFPLGRTATLSSAGRVRKERFAKVVGGGRAVSWQVREFEKLQAELSETISSTSERGRKDLEGGGPWRTRLKKGTRTLLDWSLTSIERSQTRGREIWPLPICG